MYCRPQYHLCIACFFLRALSYLVAQRELIMHPDSQLEVAIQNGFDPKQLYSSGLEVVQEPIRTILEQYSRISSAEILQHVQDLVRNSPVCI